IKVRAELHLPKLGWHCVSEQISEAVCVVRRQVRSDAHKDHPPSISADDGIARPAVAATGSGLINTGESSDTELGIAHKYICTAGTEGELRAIIRIVINQVCSPAVESDEASITANLWQP